MKLLFLGFLVELISCITFVIKFYSVKFNYSFLTMNTLFDVSEMEVVLPKEIKIITKKDKPLTKNQQVFNRLIKRVENLQGEIISEKEKLERLLKVHNEKIPANEKVIAEYQVKLARKIASTTKSVKYGKRQLENIGVVIVHLLDEAFRFIEPDKETENLYDEWAECSYQEEKESQIQGMREAMEELLRQQMGVDIDFSDLDDSPESFGRFQERLQDELNKKKQEEADFFANSKKTKKQLEKELRQKEEESMQFKSVRAIYISLVKGLHPDTETDPAEKLIKEELMKKVTAAYQEKDLPTLLKLEMEWVAAECHNLDKMSDDKLKLYISSLKEQVKELEDEKYSLSHHPRYEAISELAWFDEKQALHTIKKQLASYKKQQKALETLLSQLSQPNPKPLIMEFVNQTIDILDDSLPWGDFDFRNNNGW